MSELVARTAATIAAACIMTLAIFFTWVVTVLTVVLVVSVVTVVVCFRKGSYDNVS
jgi:fatty acid desaturase